MKIGILAALILVVITDNVLSLVIHLDVIARHHIQEWPVNNKMHAIRIHVVTEGNALIKVALSFANVHRDILVQDVKQEIHVYQVHVLAACA